ncbi:hypothetical protein [Wenzhouxiangella sp. EGI_FJ10409]|uniref:hypothetical protein n=1 Tax=Wenzhouxiangella sp. EGI_FJ10409 TaxID=3243767 RepID=UPI0035DC56B5
MGQASEGSDFESYAKIARWMAQQPDPEMRAAGWSYLARHTYELGEIDQGEYLDQVRSLVDEHPSSAVLYFLAQGCSRLEILSECREAGLPEAVRQHAGGNPLILRFFHQPGSADFRNVLIEAESLESNVGLEAQLWFRALQDGPREAPSGLSDIVTAMQVGVISGYLDLDPMIEPCRQIDEDDQALEQACQRLATRMLDSSTLLLQNLGFTLTRERALARGDQERAGELLQAQEALEGRLMCLAGLVGPRLERGDQVQYGRFLEIFTQDGEIAAFEFAAGEAASDCPPA